MNATRKAGPKTGPKTVKAAAAAAPAKVQGEGSGLFFWKLQRTKGFRPIRTASTILIQELVETHLNPIPGRMVGNGLYSGPLFSSTQVTARYKIDEALLAQGWKIVRA